MSAILSTAANRRLSGITGHPNLTRCPLVRSLRNPIPLRPTYTKTNSEQVNAQQKAHAEALLEQNVALKRRIDELRQKDSTIQNLQSEIERLKKELESRAGGPVPLDEAKQSPSGDLSSTGDFSAIKRYPILARSCSRLSRRLTISHSSSHRRVSMTSCPQNSPFWSGASSKRCSDPTFFLAITSPLPPEKRHE